MKRIIILKLLKSRWARQFALNAVKNPKVRQVIFKQIARRFGIK